MFDEYLTRWDLVLDGVPIETRTSRLLPVRQGHVPAMLKVAAEAEEKSGAFLMRWWAGNRAARVLAHEDDALLMERAEGSESLAAMARSGSDHEACRILCRTVVQLHAPRVQLPPQNLVPLTHWFRDLEPAAAKFGGILALSAATARELLANPQEQVTLHGDVHHGNILDFGGRGWLAIDPKGLYGERGFDYANLFCNPDHSTATAPDRLTRRADVVAEAAGLERRRLLQWVLAWAGLSAAWMLGDGEDAEGTLGVAKSAAEQLKNV